MKKSILFLLLAVVSFGLFGCGYNKCGGTDKGTTSAASMSHPADLEWLTASVLPSNLACEDGKLILTGTIGGVQINQSFGHSDVTLQGSYPTTFDAGFGSGGTLHLEWSGPYQRYSGTSVSATGGEFTLPLEASFSGKKYCLGEGTTLAEFDDGYRLILTIYATGVNCGTAASGRVDGCLKIKRPVPGGCSG